MLASLVPYSVTHAMQPTDPWDRPVGMIPMGASVSAPAGFLDFCRRHPEDCLPAAPSYARPQLTTRRMRELNDVNREVNEDIFFNSDLVDHWDYPQDNIGDCEDIVIEKRRRLMDLGWPEESLLITIVRLKQADFADRTTHAVLTARTAQGDYILDNEMRFAVPWTRAAELFDYVMIQSEQNPKRWALVDSAPRTP
ncbi:MAG: transglutaminase-like cysteine peptidase [Rhodospirillales bacterium]|nr:transglutaminase-like cysteine peptidase [Alphaproteobacteria bacterium]MCB9986897.1 transglutaminase-like cysteine peptidase [Rhodospirillales bacterium]USO08325.1 MAG: transglutaminase-like cysteine peptidase [Rhodospirillales bacterium]